MNRVTLFGRLVRDFELMEGNGTPYARSVVAVDRYSKDGKEATDFINLVAFGKRATNLNKFFFKGQRIGIDGKLRVSQYEKNGEKTSIAQVVVEEFQFVEKKTENPF